MTCPICYAKCRPNSQGGYVCVRCGYLTDGRVDPVQGCNPFGAGRGRALWSAWAAAGGIGEEPVRVDPGRKGDTRFVPDRKPVKMGLKPMRIYGVGARDWEGMDDDGRE